MRTRRVVITGMGAVSPFGTGIDPLISGVASNSCAIRALPKEAMPGFTSRVVAQVPAVQSKRIPRELRRTMSPMSIYACLAAWEALAMAGIAPESDTANRVGVSVGSTLGSPSSMHDFFAALLLEQSIDEVRGTTFFKVMSHSVASNLAQACHCLGRTLAPAAACATGLVGIAQGYETIAAGREEMMLCGGADEFHLLVSATFERLGAASTATDPDVASLPFDADRNGIVCAEGAGILFLESLESARQRGAHILAEILGAAMNSSPSSIAHPDRTRIGECMKSAIDDASLRPQDIAYVNAHATATEFGDIAEGLAIADVFGGTTPVGSLKGHLGHTMAASGALESVLCVEMLQSSVYFPTRGLRSPDARCGKCHFLTEKTAASGGPILKNSFALGGVNCSVVFGKIDA